MRNLVTSQSFLAFLCGVCATLTLAPFYFFPLIIIAYGGLFKLLIKAENARKAVKIGFFWGWGFYISGLYWLVIALLTEPDKFAWLIPFALFALTALIALYTSVFAWIFFHVRNFYKGNNQIFLAIIFATIWLGVEILRGYLFTGFAWNLGGYVFGASDASIQLASLVGIYGLTFLAVLIGVLSISGKKTALVTWCLLAVAVGWGGWRAENAPREFVGEVKLRLVQANIAQQHKWNPEHQLQALQKHLRLSRSEGFENITHIIWPETAIPYALADNSTLTKRLGFSLLSGQHLISGALRINESGISNSIVAINSKGEIVGQYDKRKLVPFGEFLPLRFLIPDFLETPVGMVDLAAGNGKRISSWPSLPPFIPLICYEAIFPSMAFAENNNSQSQSQSQSPEWILSVSNDAWFGASSAPYQHLAMARMRAVEQGLPLVRVANTGISAVFDAYGREIANIPLGSAGILDIDLPQKSQNRTIFTQFPH